ncbi:MAG: redoxin domain-containing protein [Firmicutes bacterium]|nr:redoxin domain-containing protein [Bacillota bacterium]
MNPGPRWDRRWALGAVALTLTVTAGIGLWHSTDILGQGPIKVPGARYGVDPGAPLGNRAAPNFRLWDQFGRQITLSSLRGKTVVLSFIDSRCTTVCPLTVQTLLDAMRLLGPSAGRVQLVAVNSNPIATSVTDVRQWSIQHGMLHKWLFLTGTVAQLRPIWHAYAIEARAIRGQVTHTPAIYVIDPRGREVRVFLNSGVRRNIPDQAYVLAEYVSRSLQTPARLPDPYTNLVNAHPSNTPLQNVAFHLGGLLNGSSTRVAVPGGKATLVDFFATWCHACQEEIPTLQAYVRHQQADPSLPPLVAVDLRLTEPSTAYVRSYLVSHKIDYPVALDNSGAVFDRFGVTELPTIALVSPQGRMLWEHAGVLSVKSLVANALSHRSKGDTSGSS